MRGSHTRFAMGTDGGAGDQRTACVIGATGATGRHLVRLLCEHDLYSLVIAVSRGGLPDDVLGGIDATKVGKLEERKVKDVEEPGDSLRGANDVFCAIGTQRRKAGSWQEFVRIDRDCVAAVAKAAKEAGASSFSLVTAQGATLRVPAWKWKIFHPLLYLRTKGEAEACVTKEFGDNSAIWRPGLLARGALARGIEKGWWARLADPLSVEDLAKAMIAKAAASQGGIFEGNKEIRSIAESF